MKSYIVSAVLVLALAVGGSFAFDAVRGPGPISATAKSLKTCTAKTPAGKIKTWRCGTDQACCVNKTMGSYVCGFPGLGCL